MTRTVTLPTVAATRAVGEALAAVLRAGDLVVLAGPLGAGKTVLAQGIGAGLRVTGAVTSPTFVIARVHRPDPAAGGRVPLVHVDAYRLGAVADPRAEVDDLDLDADAEESVTVVEWGEGVVEHLADAHLLVRIDRPRGDGGPDQAGAWAVSEPSGARGAVKRPDQADQDGVRVVELSGRGGDWGQRLAAVPLPRSG